MMMVATRNVQEALICLHAAIDIKVIFSTVNIAKYKHRVKIIADVI